MSRAASPHRSKAEHVAQQLLDRIFEAKLKPGSSFATEAKLLNQFNVSRPTMRESLKLLESQGVLELRPAPAAASSCASRARICWLTGFRYSYACTKSLS